jgi:hypothetical protein
MDRIQLFVAVMLVLSSDVSLAQTQNARSNHVSVWGPMFQSQVRKCWKKTESSSEPSKLKLKFEAAFTISLNRDGSLAKLPVPDSQTIPDRPEAYQQSALEALLKCQPYNLPFEFYDEWKHFVTVFVDFT